MVQNTCLNFVHDTGNTGVLSSSAKRFTLLYNTCTVHLGCVAWWLWRAHMEWTVVLAANMTASALGFSTKAPDS